MNPIHDILISGHNAAIANHIANGIVDGKYALQDLLDCFFSDDKMINQRSSWPLSKIADHYPNILLPYTQQLLLNLQHPAHDAVVRNTLRIWQFIEIPENLTGQVYDQCFQYLSNPNDPVAIRAFAMTVCVNIAHQYPELAEEIRLVILEHYDHSKSAFRSRGKKELKRLKILLS